MSSEFNGVDIWTVDTCILVGRLRNAAGELVNASIDLDEILGNNGGKFQWGGVDFTDTALFVDTEENEEGKLFLTAELQSPGGECVPARVHLGERIINDNGQFRFVK